MNTEPLENWFALDQSRLENWFAMDQKRLEETLTRIKPMEGRYPRPTMSVREFEDYHRTRTCSYCHTPGDLHSASCTQCGAPFNSRTIHPRMTHHEQTQAFADDLERLLDRYRHEFNLTYAQLVGVLEMAKADVIREALED